MNLIAKSELLLVPLCWRHRMNLSPPLKVLFIVAFSALKTATSGYSMKWHHPSAVRYFLELLLTPPCRQRPRRGTNLAPSFDNQILFIEVVFGAEINLVPPSSVYLLSGFWRTPDGGTRCSLISTIQIIQIIGTRLYLFYNIHINEYLN